MDITRGQPLGFSRAAQHRESRETVDLRLWGCENGGGGRQGHRDGRGHGGRHLFVFSQRDFLQEMVSASP